MVIFNFRRNLFISMLSIPKDLSLFAQADWMTYGVTPVMLEGSRHPIELSHRIF